MAKTEMWLTDDLAGILRGLVVSTDAMPDGEYRRGFLAGLTAVGVSVGISRAPDDSPVVVMRKPAPAGTGWEDFGPGNLGAFR